MNEYEKKEQQGRNLFNNWSNQAGTVSDLQFTLNLYASHDCKYFSAFTQTFAEIKTRDHSHLKTWYGEPEGFILEKQKYDCLKDLQAKARQEKKFCQLAFITIFRDALVIWDLTDTTYDTWTERLYLHSPCSGSKKKVLKKVNYLTIQQAAHVFPGKFEFQNKPA